MIVEPGKVSSVIIQYYTDEGTKLMGEPALVISNFMDTVHIQSEGGYININHETIPELIRVLKKYSTPPPKK